MPGCMLNSSHPNYALYNEFADDIRQDTPICIFTKDSIPDGNALGCGNDSDFQMMACKATFEYLR